MDDRLQKALEQSNYNVSLHLQRENLKLLLKTSLLYATAGGQFTVSRELITFMDAMIRQGVESDLIVADDKNNPILIVTPADFLKEITEVYHRAFNSYYNEFEKLKKARNVKTLAGL